MFSPRLMAIVLLGISTAAGLYWVASRPSRQKREEIRVKDYSEVYEHLTTILVPVIDRKTALQASTELDAFAARCRALPRNRVNVTLAEVEAWNQPSEKLKTAMANFQKEYVRVSSNFEMGQIIVPKLVEIHAIDPPGITPIPLINEESRPTK